MSYVPERGDATRRKTRNIRLKNLWDGIEIFANLMAMNYR